MLTDLVINPFGLSADEAVRAAAAAEVAGFSSIWLYDHLSGVVADADSSLDVWTTLGAIASATERVGLGPLVANVLTRHPAVTAVAVATLCQLAPRRVAVGLGAGAGPGSPFGSELDMVGIKRLGAADRRQMVFDAAGMMRAIWRGEPDFSGTHFHLHGATGFLAVDPPPLIVGCNGPKMAELAGQCADGANFHGSEDDLATLLDTARTAAGDRGFELSVEAPPAADWADWLAPSGDARGAMERLGVGRVMVIWRSGDGLARIERAAAIL